MARQRIGMKKIRDVIRLKSNSALSDRQIARALNISRTVVGKYWQGFLDSGLRFEQIQEMADSDLLRLIEPPKIEKSTKYRQLAQYLMIVIFIIRPDENSQESCAESRERTVMKPHKSNETFPAWHTLYVFFA